MRARTGWGKTRARAKEAHQNLVWWRAGDFLRNREVRDAIGAGRTDLDDLRRLADCDLGDAELKQVVAEVVSESARAREAWADSLWLMAYGPADLAKVRWAFYPFAISLVVLLAYIVWYLIDLTRRQQQRPRDLAQANQSPG